MMKSLNHKVMLGVVASACLAACESTSVGSPADNTPLTPGETSSASPISDTDTPQPSRQGATLVGTIRNETGEPVERCNVTLVGDTTEKAIVSDAAGEFTMGIPFGEQEITVACDQTQYEVGSFPVMVPDEERFAQEFVVKKK